jgi:hypothetical protein
MLWTFCAYRSTPRLHELQYLGNLNVFEHASLPCSSCTPTLSGQTHLKSCLPRNNEETQGGKGCHKPIPKCCGGSRSSGSKYNFALYLHLYRLKTFNSRLDANTILFIGSSNSPTTSSKLSRAPELPRKYFPSNTKNIRSNGIKSPRIPPRQRLEGLHRGRNNLEADLWQERWGSGPIAYHNYTKNNPKGPFTYCIIIPNIFDRAYYNYWYNPRGSKYTLCRRNAE